MNVDEYLRRVTPISILDLLEDSALQNMLDGYSYALNSGVAIVFPRSDPISINTLDRRDAKGEERRSTFNSLCRYWRAPDGCGQDAACFEADKVEAMKHFRNEFLGPRLYRCRTLGLWEMTYPVKAGSRIVGVLFGGQIAVSGTNNWRESLGDRCSLVDWTVTPECDSHMDAVKRTIIAPSIPEFQKQGLLQTLYDESGQNSTIVPIEKFRKRVEDFLRFGRTAQGLVDALYESRKVVAQQELMHDCDKALDDISLADEKTWWAGCAKLLDEMRKLPDVEAIQLYGRTGARYRLRASTSPSPSSAERLLARDVVPACPLNQLVAVDPTRNKNLLAAFLGVSHENVWGYRSGIGEGRELFSILLVFSGSLATTERGVLRDLSGQISAAAEFAQLLFRERNVDADYRQEVRLIGHSFRTPLQALQFLLEDLRDAPPVAATQDLMAKTHRGLERIFDASQDLIMLLEPPARQQEAVFDLAELLNYVISSMRPIADQHPCIVVRSREAWPTEVPIRGIRYRVQRGLTNLLDNAIKYSFVGIDRKTSSHYEVRVRLVVADGYARVTMENYGIGIPPEKLAALAEYGVRGEVRDYLSTRPGSGLGLPFAIEVFEELGGWIHLTSIPAPSATAEERQSYHRYITIVEAALPIAKRS